MEGYDNKVFRDYDNDIDVTDKARNSLGSHDVTGRGTNGYSNPAYSGSEIDVTEKSTNGVRHDKVVAAVDTARLPEETYDKDEDIRCGLGACEPDCFQVFNNPKCMLAWLCWFAFIQGFMVNGINNVSLTSLERRFELSSSQSGLISSAYDISAGILAIPVTYYGAHAHQPRMLTFAALIMSCGAFIMTVPHFATELYDLGTSQSDECLIGNFTSPCDEPGSGSTLYMWLGVLILGMILNGIGGTILYSIGIVFLDSSVSTSASPLYQGFLYGSSTLGPACGFVLGGYFVGNFYVDIDKVDSASITVDSGDARFIGAWWIGFLASGVMLITVVLLLMCYPRQLPAARKARMKRKSEVHQTDGNTIASREGFGKKWRDMPMALKILLTNPVYMCINMTGVFEGLAVSGMATFMAKFVQNQFSVSAGFAGILFGAVSVPGAGGGQFTGGLICRLAKLSVRGMLRLAICSSCLAGMLFFIVFSRCTSPHIAGINVHYENTSIPLEEVNLISSYCNAECGCTTLSYEPICGSNDVQYFSPCHAGCQKDTVNGSTVFVNCTCIQNNVFEPSKSAHTATDGICAVDCTLMYMFLPLLFLLIFTLFLAAVPSLSTTIRVVPESQRAFAIGVQWVFIRFLGTIPGPILMGAVFDSTCEVWQDRCDSTGSCWIYNGGLLSARVLFLTLSVKVLSTIFFALALAFYKPPKEDELDTSLGDNTGSNDIARALGKMGSRTGSENTVVTTVSDQVHVNPGAMLVDGSSPNKLSTEF